MDFMGFENPLKMAVGLVEHNGVEPLTSSMPWKEFRANHIVFQPFSLTILA
jgi:hypothetical protein